MIVARRTNDLLIAGVFNVHSRSTLSARVRRLLFRRPEFSGTVLAPAFDVIVLGQRWNERSIFAELARMAQDDLRFSVVILHRAIDFDRAAFQGPNVAEVFEIVRKDDDCERTGFEVFAEVQKRYSLALLPSLMLKILPLTYCVFPMCRCASEKATQSAVAGSDPKK